MAYLYVFIDESGNDDFSRKGTKFWTLTSMLLLDPAAAKDALFTLKHQVIDEGINLHYFHATEDKQPVRDRVFDILKGLQRGQCRVDSVVVRKNRTAPKKRLPEVFYPMMVEMVLKYQFHELGANVRRFEKVLVFLDRPSRNGSEIRALTDALHACLPAHLKGVPYSILFHASASHHGLQMVDYFSWAIYVKHERGENRPLETVEHLVRSEFEIFRNGQIVWYPEGQ